MERPGQVAVGEVQPALRSSLGREGGLEMQVTQGWLPQAVGPRSHDVEVTVLQVGLTQWLLRVCPEGTAPDPLTARLATATSGPVGQ